MRRIVRTEALCLRAHNWRETSKVVTMLTPDLGLVSAIARGARGPKSRLGAAVQLFALSRITLYLPRSGNLGTVGDADLITAYSGMTADYNRFLAASRISRFLLAALARFYPEPRVFELVKSSFAAIADAPAQTTDFSGVWGSFILKTSAFLGFRPVLERCLRCGQPVLSQGDKEGVLAGVSYFDVQRGGVVCPGCGELDRKPGNTVIAVGDLARLKILLHTPSAKLVGVELPAELLELINRYAVYQLEITPRQRRKNAENRSNIQKGAK